MVLALYLHLAAAGSKQRLLLGGTVSFLGPNLHLVGSCALLAQIRQGGPRRKKTSQVAT